MGDSTADPSDDEFQDCEDFDSTFSDDDEFPIGPASANDQELSHKEKDKEDNQEELENAFQSNLEVNKAGEFFEVPSKRPRRRHWRPSRRDPLGIADFICLVLLPVLCAMAAVKVEAEHFEMADLEMLQQVAGPEPGKTVVPPGEVR